MLAQVQSTERRPRVSYYQPAIFPPLQPIVLFTDSFSHLHYNAIHRGCEAISGQNYKIARIASHTC